MGKRKRKKKTVAEDREAEPKKGMPLFFRIINSMAGIIVFFALPILGASTIIEGRFVQEPNSGTARRAGNQGYELYGPAARVFGGGLICLGLSIGYGLGFRIHAMDGKGNKFKANKLDKFAIGVLVLAIVLVFVAQFLPTRTKYGEGPRSQVEYSDPASPTVSSPTVAISNRGDFQPLNLKLS